MSAMGRKHTRQNERLPCRGAPTIEDAAGSIAFLLTRRAVRAPLWRCTRWGFICGSKLLRGYG
jgi:hypothetical protein